MKSRALPGVVYIAVSAAEPGVCRIGRAVGQSAETRVRQWSCSNPAVAPWCVFAERSVADVSACLSEVHRILKRYRDPVRSRGREMFHVPPEKAQMILQIVARRFPSTKQNDDEATPVPESIQDDDEEALLVAPIQGEEPPVVTPAQEREEEPPVVPSARVENIADAHVDPREGHDGSSIQDNAETRQEPPGSNRAHRRAFAPIESAIVSDAFPWVIAALLLVFAGICAMAGPVVIAPGILFFAVFWSARGAFSIDAPAEVSASPEGLLIDGKLRLPLSALRGGFVVPDEPRKPLVLLERRRGRPLKLRVRTEREGRELLLALGLDASQKAVTIHALCGPLTIGIDGLACSRPDGQSVFISSAEIAGISTYESPGAGRSPTQRGVDLVLHDGRSARIPLTQSDNDPLLELVRQRIHECVELARERLDREEDNDAIARRNRKGVEWLRGLRASASGGYRTAALDEKDLSRILRDEGAKPSARAAAAIVLASSGDAGAPMKLRIAADTIANPRVRVALESIASMRDDGAMAEALEVLDEAEHQERAGYSKLERTEDESCRNDDLTS